MVMSNDGPGREYRLRSDRLQSRSNGFSDNRAATLSTGGEPGPANLLARMGSFLDAFGTGDTE